MLDRVAVFSAPPIATFLTLLLELLLSLGIGEAKTESDCIVLNLKAVKVFDDSLSNLA